MRLADDFFFIAWDTTNSGTPLLHSRATALGLAGGLLGELVLAERIAIQNAGLRVVDQRPVDNELSQNVLSEMTDAPEHAQVRTWLAYLARDSIADVADRMVEDGLVERTESRVLWRKQVRYVATDYAKGAWPAVRIGVKLARESDLTTGEVALAGLVEATGLLNAVVLEPRDRSTARRHLTALQRNIPRSLRDLASHVQAAVGDAVLSYRS